MKSGEQTPLRMYRVPIRHGLFLLISTCAAITLLTEVARATGASFAVYSWLAGAVTLVIPAAAWPLIRGAPVPRERPATLVTVMLLGVVCAVFAAATLRFSADTYYYVPNAIYYLQHPRQAMGYDVFFLHAPDGHFRSYWWSTAGAYEYYPAALAHLLGMRYLDLYFVLRPALLGFLLPVVIYLLLTTLSAEEAITPYAMVSTVACLLLLGETHRTFLNMSITRFCEGKTVLLALGVPLFMTESFAFMCGHRRGSWAFLCLLCIALCGCSSSTILLLPPLAFAVALCFLLAGHDRPPFGQIVAYLASLAYLPVLILTSLSDPSTPRFDDVPNQGWPRDLAGHLAFLINREWPLSPILLAAGVTVTILLAPPRLSRFSLLFCATLVLTIFNPWLAPLLIRVTSSPNIYWRLFYLLPVGMFLGLAANEIHVRCKSRQSRAALWCMTAVLLLAAYLATPFNITRIPAAWSADPGGKAPPDALANLWKVPRPDLAAARELLAVTPPGVMLAPAGVGSLIPLLDSHYPQMRLRDDAELWWFTLRHEASYGEQRIQASQFLGGGAAPFAAFAAVLQRECGALRSIVAVSPISEDLRVKVAVNACGLSERRKFGGYTVAFRPGEASADGAHACAEIHRSPPFAVMSSESRATPPLIVGGMHRPSTGSGDHQAVAFTAASLRPEPHRPSHGHRLEQGAGCTSPDLPARQ
jgi:hypothetical protein